MKKEDPSKLWSVVCRTEGGAVLGQSLTKEEAIEVARSHRRDTKEHPFEQLTTFHDPEILHPDLVIDRINVVGLLNELGSIVGANVLANAVVELLLVEEFFDKYSYLSREKLLKPLAIPMNKPIKRAFGK